MLTRIDIDIFLFYFSHQLVFLISSFNIGFIIYWTFLFFLAQPYDLGYEFIMLTWIDLGIFCVIFFSDFIL